MSKYTTYNKTAKGRARTAKYRASLKGAIMRQAENRRRRERVS